MTHRDKKAGKPKAGSSKGGKWHEHYPELGTGPLPVAPYYAESRFEEEREHLFRKVWLMLGRVEQIPQPGDYFVHDIAICKTSVIAVRGSDGVIRAFHNHCSHRGNKLAWDRGGSCQGFTCKLHAWSYGLDGALRFVPDEESFFSLDKRKLGLTPIALEVWEGFIFVNFDPSPQETLQAYLGDLGESMRGYPFAELSATSATWTTEVRANWKLVKDGFQEVYHVPFLHRRSIPDSFISRENPFAHLLHMELRDRHARISLFGNAGLQPTPVQAAAFRHGSFAVRSNFSEARLPAGVNPARAEAWAFDLNILFPCLILAVSERSYFTHQFWPVAPDRTIWKSTQYFPRAETAGQRFSQEYGHVIFRDVILEDGKILEQTQSMLESGAKQSFVLHDEEMLVRHSHHVIERLIAEGIARAKAAGSRRRVRKERHNV